VSCLRDLQSFCSEVFVCHSEVWAKFQEVLKQCLCTCFALPINLEGLCSPAQVEHSGSDYENQGLVYSLL